VRFDKDSLLGAAAVVATTTLWLVLMDRIGVGIVEGQAWCGLYGLWMLFAGHSLMAGIVAAATLAVRAVARRHEWRWNWLVAGALAALLALLVGWPFFDAPTEGLRPGKSHHLSGAVVSVAIGLAAAYFARRARSAWHQALWGPISLICAMIDATVYPALVAHHHLIVYLATVTTATWGIGLPLSRILPTRAPQVFRVGVPALALLGLIGLAPLLLFERGGTAAASPGLARLLKRFPSAPPEGVLARALSTPAVPLARDDPAKNFPRGKERWSVLFITVDAFRADALLDPPQRGSYLEPGDTPILDQWVPGTFHFLSAYSQGNSTISAFRGMFQGRRPNDEAEGASIPDIGRRLGLVSAAVVPVFFRVDWLFRTAIGDFDHVELYDLQRQEHQLEQLEATLAALNGERFFLWTHFYCTHDPYYTERGPGRLRLRGPIATARVRDDYRGAVRWLDRQLGRLFQALRATGRADSTVVILTADHGEHVGEGLRMGHGEGMHREDILVPLVVHVPGTSGGKISSVAGNADILPTVVDLLGDEPEPRHRGRSLVPLMQSRSEKSGRSYYVKGYVPGQYALVTDEDLIVYEEALGAFQRYSRERGAESGQFDRFGDDPASDERLASMFVRAEPRPFAGELRAPALRDDLARRLRAPGASTPNDDLEFWVRAAVSSGDLSLAFATHDAAAHAPSLEAKLRIATELHWRDPEHWSRFLGDILVGRLRTAEEREVVELFARYEVPLVAARAAQTRLAELPPDRERELVDAWLSLTRTWSKPVGFVAPMAHLISEMDRATTLDERRLRSLLDSVAALEVSADQKYLADVRRLAAWVGPLVRDSRRDIAQRACRALGAVGAKEDIALLRQVADSDRSPSIRRAALKSVARLEGAGALPYLETRARDPVLAVAALDAIIAVGSQPSIAWMQAFQASTDSPVLKEVAKDGATNIQKRISEAGKQPAASP
jgi:hypothetical protein